MPFVTASAFVVSVVPLKRRFEESWRRPSVPAYVTRPLVSEEFEIFVVDAFVTESFESEESKVKAAESVKRPAVVMNGTRVIERLVAVRLGVESAPVLEMVVDADCPAAKVFALSVETKDVVEVAFVKIPSAEKIGMLNSKRSVELFQVMSALGDAVPRLKISVMSSASFVALSVFMVKEFETVPAIELDAAERLFTTSSST